MVLASLRPFLNFPFIILFISFYSILTGCSIILPSTSFQSANASVFNSPAFGSSLNPLIFLSIFNFFYSILGFKWKVPPNLPENLISSVTLVIRTSARDLFFFSFIQEKKENPCHISGKGILQLEVIDDIV